MSEFFSIIITKYLFTGVIKRKSYVFSMFSGFYCRLGDLFIVESNVKLDIMDTSTCITKLLTSKTGKRDRSAVASFFLFKDIPHTIETPSTPGSTLQHFLLEKKHLTHGSLGNLAIEQRQRWAPLPCLVMWI